MRPRSETEKQHSSGIAFICRRSLIMATTGMVKVAHAYGIMEYNCVLTRLDKHQSTLAHRDRYTGKMGLTYVD